MAEQIAKRIIIEGSVQGVYFRDWTKRTASEYGLDGWVRNKTDKTVEAVFKGDGDKVNSMIKECYKGSPASNVSNITEFPLSDIEPVEKGFVIRSTV